MGMKMIAWYEPEPKEVEVEITIEDIRNFLRNEPESSHEAFRILNNCVSAIKAITNEMVVGMTDPQRQAVRNFFLEQAEKYNR
jgi:hypothetical protein